MISSMILEDPPSSGQAILRITRQCERACAGQQAVIIVSKVDTARAVYALRGGAEEVVVSLADIARDRMS